MKYLRFKLFEGTLKVFSKSIRKRRTKKFIELMKPKESMRVLDIGGQPSIWDDVDISLNITILNLPGVADTDYQSHHKITYLEGDGCNMPEFEVGYFDLVFSNSVIEHVGNDEKRGMLAKEIQRLSSHYWIQTPYKYYPIEAHCGMPFWWLYPKAVRSLFIERWKRKLPDWAEMIEGTDIISSKELKNRFPTANIFMEWFIFPKSLVVYSNK